MTNEELRRLMGQVSAGCHTERLQFRQISEQYGRAVYWPAKLDGSAHMFPSRVFLRFCGRECIASVHDLGAADLHGMTVRAHRRAGIMKDLLTNFVLPHISAEGRGQQHVTFLKPAVATFLERCGFSVQARGGDGEEGRASIKLECHGSGSYTPVPPAPLSKQHADEIVRRIKQSSQLLEAAASEAELHLGECQQVERIRNLAESAFVPRESLLRYSLDLERRLARHEP